MWTMGFLSLSLDDDYHHKDTLPGYIQIHPTTSIRIWSVLKIPRLSLLIIWFEKWQIKEEKLGDFLARRFVSNIEPEIFHSFWRRPKIPELIRSTRIGDGWIQQSGQYWQRKLNKVKSIIIGETWKTVMFVFYPKRGVLENPNFP